jgi:tRNA threonylcarbamoyladenosine biosynthesis protein TsaB
MTEEQQAPLILAIETATRAGSVCVVRGKTVLSSLSGDPDVSHSSDLLEKVDQVLRQSKTELSELNFLAAAVGPGSFTGIRIGLATIKALGVCLGLDCIGISTLAAIAHAAGASTQTATLLPAGRGEIYAQLFRVTADGATSPLESAAHLKLDDVLERYAEIESLKWAGEGALINAPLLKQRAQERGIGLNVDGNCSSGPVSASKCTLAAPSSKLAESVAALAWIEYQRGRRSAPNELRAIYVRPSDAELNKK